MPLFSARRPPGIAKAIATMFASSPELTAGEQVAIEEKAANLGYRHALTQKALAEVEAARAADAARRNPDTVVRYGAHSAGIDLPIARQLRDAIEGRDLAAGQMDDEGNAMPPAVVQRPSGVSGEQERLFRSALAAAIANEIGTGKTNADQLAHATGRANENFVRNSAVNLDPAAQNARVGPYRASAREPYGSVNAQGLTVNQETGEGGSVAPALTNAAVAALQALDSQRQASAGLARVRTETEPVRAGAASTSAGAAAANAATNASVAPSRIAANNAAAARSTAQAGSADALTADRGSRAAEREEAAAQTRARSGFRADPKMKGLKLGAWERGRGYRVLNKDNVVVGYYD